MASAKLLKSKERLKAFAQTLENKNDSQSMCEFIEDEFTVLCEQLDFLNVFTNEEKALIESSGPWRLSKNDLGLMTLENYLVSESIVKDDGKFLYSLFDEQEEQLVVESMPFIYLENLINYRAGNVSCRESCDSGL